MSQESILNSGEENVLIKAGDCAVTLLPLLGGKIASIRLKDQELLQAPLAPPVTRTPTMAFDASDASGWDECLPSVAGCTVEMADGFASIPDHGDLWRVAWEQAPTREDYAVTLRGHCFSLPFELERSVAMKGTSKGWNLRLDYKLTNTGSEPAPWSWSAHPLFAVEAGDRILLPSSISTLRLEGSAGGRLGQRGDAVAWPVARQVDGGQLDLSAVLPPDSGLGEKLFAGPLAGLENWCAIYRPKAGVRLKVQFDAKATPFLGLWLCYGGWPDRPGPKQNCVAIEPCTANVDSLAEAGYLTRMLAPGDSYAWPMSVDIELI